MTTIERGVDLTGIGIHSGERVRLSLLPAVRGGIVFRRSDLDGPEIPLSARNPESERRTVLGQGRVRIQTVEHLLAAVLAAGITDMVIELDGGEVPVFDGSALPFVSALEKAGRSSTGSGPVSRLLEPFTVRENRASLTARPAEEFRITYTIRFDHPLIGVQSLSLAVTEDVFNREIAPARTFGFLKDVPDLRRRELAKGGSLENALVLDDKGLLNGPLRYPDEFVRHKILDLIGDLALLGRKPLAHFIADGAGHPIHHAALRYWLDHPEIREESVHSL